MIDPAVTTLFTYGPLGVIAWVFFTGYFDDKKRSEAFDSKRMEHEKSMAVIIAEATKAINGNHEIVKDTKQMHIDMDDTLTGINQSIVRISSELTKNCVDNDDIKKDLRHIVAQVDGILKTLKETE